MHLSFWQMVPRWTKSNGAAGEKSPYLAWFFYFVRKHIVFEIAEISELHCIKLPDFHPNKTQLSVFFGPLILFSSMNFSNLFSPCRQQSSTLFALLSWGLSDVVTVFVGILIFNLILKRPLYSPNNQASLLETLCSERCTYFVDYIEYFINASIKTFHKSQIKSMLISNYQFGITAFSAVKMVPKAPGG